MIPTDTMNQEKAYANESNNTDETTTSPNSDGVDISFDANSRENNGVNAGQLNGNVSFHTEYKSYSWYSAFTEPPLADRRVPEAKQNIAQNHFVPRPGFEDALAVLQRNNLLFLRGQGTGRSLAALRMLEKCGAQHISQLHERRSFDSAANGELDPDCGYLWDGTEPHWQLQITPQSADRVASWAQRNNCYLVVPVDCVLPPELKKYECTLGQPDPVQVAKECLHALTPCTIKETDDVLHEFRDLIRVDSPPNDAEYIAMRAWGVYSEDQNLESARQDISRDCRLLVRKWFQEDRSTIEYAMLVAISVFENRPYADVMGAAEALEKMISETDLSGTNKTLEPRKVFDFSKSTILRHLEADTSIHPHAEGLALYKETVHFRRSDWAREAFRRAWDEYDLLRPVIVQWMAQQVNNDFQWYCAKALHDVLANMPNNDPMQHIDDLAKRRSPRANELAAELLARFADDEGIKDVVEPVLSDWCTRSGNFHRKWTAALFYAADERSQSRGSLTQLKRIACTDRKLANAVKAAVIKLLDRSDNRINVLSTLVEWTKPLARRDMEQLENLRLVGLECAQAALGLKSGTRYLRSLPVVPDRERLGDPHPRLVARLFRRVFLDQNTRLSALRALLEWCESCEKDLNSEDARGLAQLVATVAPDLHHFDRHPLFEDWKALLPGSSAQIDRAFSTLQLLHQRYGRFITLPAA